MTHYLQKDNSRNSLTILIRFSAEEMPAKISPTAKVAHKTIPLRANIKAGLHVGPIRSEPSHKI